MRRTALRATLVLTAGIVVGICASAQFNTGFNPYTGKSAPQPPYNPLTGTGPPGNQVNPFTGTPAPAGPAFNPYTGKPMPMPRTTR
jgi:hypothetical protein